MTTPVEAVLSRSPLLEGFSPTGLQIVAAAGVERRLARGTVLFAENQPGDSMFFVGEGRVAIGVQNDTGRNQLVGSLGPGEALGSLCLLQPTTRMCTALAETDVVVIELRADDFKKVLAQKPQACIKLLLAVATQFGKALSENKAGLRSLVGRS